MKSEVLVEWNPWWSKKTEFNLLDRDLKKEITGWINKKEIIGILGVRRGGKTSLMYLLIEHLLKSINPKNILFIKCDDDRVDKENLISDSIEKYKEFLNPKERIFVFIDEIQEINKWENTLKRMYDLEKEIKFFISGSNFSILKEDLSYKLAGRFAYFELYPFSFDEFVKLNLKAKNKVSLISKKHEIKHLLRKYIEFGGFPEIVLEKDKKKKIQLLQFYYDTIIYRDIIKRRKVRNTAKMEKMINYFLQNIANPANFSKIAKLVSLSADSISEYVKYLQDAFFIFSIPLFSFSLKKQEMNAKKIYCVDTGIRNVKGSRFSKDYGKIIENIVFVELKRKYSINPLSEIFYWQNKKSEVDFVIKDGTKIKELVQVCWDVRNKETKEREIRALIKASKELKCKNLFVITEDYEKEEGCELFGIKREIKFIPLWKWLVKVN